MGVDQVGSDSLDQIPLIPMTGWPGVCVSYHFHPSSVKGEAILAIEFEFNSSSTLPEQGPGIHPPAEPPEELEPRGEWQPALDQYKLIAAQLEDPRVHISVYTSIAGGALNDEGVTRHFLQEFAGKAEAQIHNALGADSPHDVANDSDSQSITQSMVLPVPFAPTLAHPICILPLKVSVAFERDDAPPCSTDIRESLTCPEICREAAADDEPADEGAPRAALSGGRLDAFARCFEAAFEGFDGESGLLKIALATGAHAAGEDSKTPTPWVIRWGRAAGIFARLQNSPAYFALKPLSNKLITHGVDGLTYADVDIDLLAKEFLATVELCLKSMNAGAADDSADGGGKKDCYDQLVSHHRALAEIIPSGLTRPFVTQQQRGDLGVARQHFTRALLKSLPSAFSVTTAQFPAEVDIPDEAGSGRGLVPTLMGGVGPPSIDPPADAAASVQSPEYAFSDGELKLSPGRTWLTFGISVPDTHEHAVLEVPLTFRATQLRLDLHPEEGQEGAPSPLLKLVLPDESPLVMPATGGAPARVPLPLPFHPAPPALIKHSAVGADPSTRRNNISSEIEESMRWVYEAQIGHDWARQDTLQLTPIYNPRAEHSPQGISTVGEDDHRVLSLFEALARFRREWPSLSTAFGSGVDEAHPNGGAMIDFAGDENHSPEKFIREVGNVVTAWGNLYKPVHTLENQRPSRDADPADVCRVVLDSTRKGRLHLYKAARTDEGPEHWPTIITRDGSEWTPESGAQPAGPAEGWRRRSHDFGPEADFSQLTFRWGPFNVRSLLTASLSAQISRNANLSDDAADAIDPQFIYLTSSRRFARPVTPLIQRGSFQLLQPEDTLLKTVEAVIEPLKTHKALPALLAEGGGDSRLRLRLGASYAYNVTNENTGEHGLRVSNPILLADDISSAQDGAADEIVRAIGKWYEATQPPADEATLVFAVTVFAAAAERQLPVLRIEEIPINVSRVSNEWWLR